HEKAFDLRFKDFAEFTNGKIQIRTEKDKTKLRDEVAAYSSNCARFSAGIVAFAEWAITGKASKGYNVIFQDWVKEAKEAGTKK
ncbi:MAG: hypothetical protein GY915_00075, partial [bacterium]|nr:hypothetical protein [bacterium]